MDFQQAYDCVNWQILRSLFQKFGFGVSWCKWMEACIFNSSLSILVNGSPMTDFLVEIRLRQGDPLSLFLFTLVAEGLCILFNSTAASGSFEGYQVGTGVDVKLLQFTDDTEVVGKGSWNNLRSIKAIFKGFELISGLKVNFHKSKVIGVNLEESFIESTSHFLSCYREKIPFKFLGILVSINLRRGESWKEVMSLFKRKLLTWKSRLLSMGGRVTLLNSVLSSVPIYTMHFYRTPVKVIKELISIQSRFLWGGNEDKKYINWVSWHNTYKPKEDGGLGIKHLGQFNNSLLTKWKWRFLSEGSSVWREILEERYGDVQKAIIMGATFKLKKKEFVWWKDMMQVTFRLVLVLVILYRFGLASGMEALLSNSYSHYYPVYHLNLWAVSTTWEAVKSSHGFGIFT